MELLRRWQHLPVEKRLAIGRPTPHPAPTQLAARPWERLGSALPAAGRGNPAPPPAAQHTAAGPAGGIFQPSLRNGGTPLIFARAFSGGLSIFRVSAADLPRAGHLSAAARLCVKHMGTANFSRREAPRSQKHVNQPHSCEARNVEEICVHAAISQALREKARCKN